MGLWTFWVLESAFCVFEVFFFLFETFFLAYWREVLTDGLAHRVGAMGLL